jgi:hypothetical protein
MKQLQYNGAERKPLFYPGRKGQTTGVFIPIEEWNEIKNNKGLGKGLPVRDYWLLINSYFETLGIIHIPVYKFVKQQTINM